MLNEKAVFFAFAFVSCPDSHLSQPLTQAARQSQTSSCLRRKLGKTLLESLDLIQKSTSAAIYSFTYLTLIISWQNKLAHKRFSPSIYSWSKDDSYIFTFYCRLLCFKIIQPGSVYQIATTVFVFSEHSMMRQSNLSLKAVCDISHGRQR